MKGFVEDEVTNSAKYKPRILFMLQNDVQLFFVH